MKHLCLVGLILTLGSGAALAGQISGTIRSGNNALSGEAVVISCGGETGKGTTDSNGRYSVYISKTGSCTLSLPNRGNASATVFSSAQPTRHDFTLSGNSLRKR